MVTFVGKQQASKTLDLSGETLKRYRLEGKWIEGIHWVRLNSRCVRYNLELIQDWFHNQHDPTAHFRAIEAYQETLLSNQRKSARKPKQ
ncbi:MAG: hypothetical protein ACKO24_05255 [Leptolyngbyaceae cyanobacterium]